MKNVCDNYINCIEIKIVCIAMRVSTSLSSSSLGELSSIFCALISTLDRLAFVGFSNSSSSRSISSPIHQLVEGSAQGGKLKTFCIFYMLHPYLLVLIRAFPQCSKPHIYEGRLLLILLQCSIIAEKFQHVDVKHRLKNRNDSLNSSTMQFVSSSNWDNELKTNLISNHLHQRTLPRGAS